MSIKGWKRRIMPDTSGLAAAIWLTLLAMLVLVSITATAGAPAVVKLWNYNVHDKKYQQKMYKLFNERNPDIKLDYSSISNTVYGQVLEAAFIAKDPPDLFLPGDKLNFNYLRDKGWVRPLSDVAPDEKELKEWMAKYPPQLLKFVEGRSVFDGKPYIVDLHGESNSAGMPLYFNKTLYRDAGIGKPPAIQSELRKTAAKVSSAGQGKYYGIVTGLGWRGGAWNQNVGMSLAVAAGVTGGAWWGPDKKDGRFHMSSPEFIQAFKVWVDMRLDGSVFPGELGMEDEAAKMTFATNKASMFFGGSWVPGNVLAYNPDVDFDLVLPPTPDDGIRRGYVSIEIVGGADGYLVSSSAKSPRAVWEVIKFISGLEYQVGYVRGGFGISYLPEANRLENFQVPQMYKFVEWGMDPALRRVVPSWPPEVGKVFEYLPGLYPTYSDVLDSVYLGKSGFDAFKDLDRRCDEAIDIAIKKAQEAGVKVSRADFAFPDWDPTKDYVQKKK